MKAKHLGVYLKAVESLRPALEALHAEEIELTVDARGVIRLQFSLGREAQVEKP